MASENETVAEIVKRVRRECNSYPLPTAAAEMLKLVREFQVAHKREITEKDAEIAELQRKYADACKCCDDAERRLRVAKDALRNLVDEEGIVCDCEIVYKANNVITMICGEGGHNEQH